MRSQQTSPSARPAYSTGRHGRQAAGRLLREASLELGRLRRIRGPYKRTWRRIAAARAQLAFAAALLAGAVAEPVQAGDPLFQPTFVDERPRLSGHPWVSESPALADLDADGDLDAITGGGPPYYFENTGTTSAPAFDAPVSLALGGGVSPVAPSFADIDGDGDLDAFVGEGSGSTVFQENTGTASAPAFAAAVANPFGLTDVGTNASPTFADLDADGDLDALVGRGSGGTAFFRNTGTASAPAFAALTSNAFGLVPVGAPDASPDLVDLDGDGDLDAVIGSAWWEMYFENTGSASAPAFAAPLTNAFGAWWPSSAFGDLDADGDLDRLLQAFVYENTGSVSAPDFYLPPPPPDNPIGLYGAPTFADIDGDGDLDAFGVHGPTAFFENTGSATAPAFAVPSTNPFGLAAFSTYALELTDIDGDGDLDAFVGTWWTYQSPHIHFFENSGTAASPAFATGVTEPFGLGGTARDFADVDGDGDLDAFGIDGGFFENTGTASAPAFAAPELSTFGLPPNGGRDFVDIDGDGDLDAFVDLDGYTYVYRNTGTATAPAFASVSTSFGLTSVGCCYSGLALTDIDGDGDLDAFIEGESTRVFFFENLELGPGTCSDGLDNDGDGRIDLGVDPGCGSAADPSERSTLQCDNGLDDDGDGQIDWRGDGSGDPDCVSLTGGSELRPPRLPGCGIGPELLLLGPILAARQRRRLGRRRGPQA